MAEHSTITETARWDPRVGRWIEFPPPPPVAPPTSAPAPAAPLVAARVPLVPLAARMYASARQGRTTAGFGSSGASSADAELATSLANLRARSRQMVRDNPYAKRARKIVVNNVIGPGVGMQAQVMNTRGQLHATINDAIEEAFCEWCDASSCHTGGALHFHDLERMAMGQVFEAGEVLVRLHYAAAGRSRVPLVLELIESERLPDEFMTASLRPQSGNTIRMGVEVDRFHRAVAYHIRIDHPGDVRFGAAAQAATYERVPAEDVIHLRIVDRWPQTRGEPWLHTVLRKLDDMNEYSASEVEAARLASYYFATVKSTPDPSGPPPLANQGAGTGQGDQNEAPTYDIQSGMVQHLDPGEELVFHTPNRPNTAIDPFLRYMLREVAAGSDASYESLSRDYSQTTYSSGRLAVLDDRDLWRVYQQWWIRNFRLRIHRVFLRLAVLSNAIRGLAQTAYWVDPARHEKVLFKPRGWSWVDPTKEVAAYKEAVKAGFTTITDVIAATAGGQDIEDVVGTRKRELEMLEEAEIAVDTTVPTAPAADGATAGSGKSGGEDGPDDGVAADQDENNDPQARVVSFRR